MELHKDLISKLKPLAKERGVTITALVKIILFDYFKNLDKENKTE